MILKLIFILSSVFFSCTSNSGTGINRSLSDTTFVYWENLTEIQKNVIIKSESASKEAIEFYNGKFKIGDNDQTIALLNTLTSTYDKDKTAPFYFFLFNQICIKADGALSEILGDYCQRIVLSSPAYVVTYFSRNESILKKYAQYLGYELYFKEEGTSTIEYNYSDFKKLLSEKLANTEQSKDVLTLFYNKIEEVMKNMD